MLAVIGGTGFGEFVGLDGLSSKRVATVYGEAYLETGTLSSVPVLFLPRHGHPANTPPHKINYRANIQALLDHGATGILAVTAVGSVDETLLVPHLVIPDQIIDYTWGRGQTFFDEEIHHIDFTFPYDDGLRGLVTSAANEVCEVTGLPLRVGAVYGCTQGPRLESAAEIQRMAQDGCHIVGMTAMPECSLARERELAYAGMSVVVNAGAGIGGQAVDLSSIQAAMTKGMDSAREVVREVARRYSAAASGVS